MSLKATPTEIPDVLIIDPPVFGDHRGFFMEVFHAKKYAELGIPHTFVQDNRSQSSKGILRGLHYQKINPQAKLVSVLAGEIFDVAVDIRKESPTFGKWVGVYLSGENKKQLYIPQGFAHGFYVVSKTADVMYKCSDLYNPAGERGLLWSDPAVGIDWSLDGKPALSEKDTVYPVLADIPEEDLF
ncbi:MAG: dTDP-4-dehydrorhamnose 3,5-epimerase [Calditrichia bacterium]